MILTRFLDDREWLRRQETGGVDFDDNDDR
jgi:hypothetical protein